MSATPLPRADRTGRLGLRPGPLLMVLASLVFTVMISLVKLARAELSAAEIVLWRSVVSVPLAALALRGLSPRPRALGLLAARVMLGFGAMITFFSAAKGLNLATHSLLNKLQPLLVAVLAPAVLGQGERPGQRVWVALLLGMLGCALLLSPELRGGWVWGLLAVGSAFFSAGAHTSLRALGRTDHPAVVVLWFQAGLVPLSLLMLVGLDRQLPALPSPDMWPLLAGVGACAVLGQTLMTRAYQLDRAAVVAGAAYSAPLFAMAADLLLFATAPTWHTLAGGLLVVIAGMLVVWAPERPVPPAEH